MKNTIKGIGQSLGSPGKAFTGEDYHKASRLLIIFMLYACYLVSSLLSVQTQKTETFKEIQYNIAIQTAEKQMAGTTEEQKAQMREAVREQLDSPMQSTIQLVSIVIFSWFSLVYVLITWAIVIILSRMLGGEETPLDEKKHRRTFYLSLYAGIPMALSGVAAGILIITKNPDSYASMLTMSDYMREMQVSPSLYYVFRPSNFDPGIFLGTLFATITDPFYWWGYGILIVGMRDILRLDIKKAVGIALGIVILLSGFTYLLQLPAMLIGG